MEDRSASFDPARQPNDEAVDGVVYNYGMAMYLIQVLEHQVVNLIVASKLPRVAEIPADELKRIRAATFKKTLGTTLKDLIASVDVPDELRCRLKQVCDERNRLAHRFFRENHDVMQTVGGNGRLVAELASFQQVVVDVDDELTELERALWKANGMSYPF